MPYKPRKFESHTSKPAETSPVTEKMGENLELGPTTLVGRVARWSKTFKFIEVAAAIIGLAGIVLSWNPNLRVILPLAAVLLVGGLLMLILDWAGLISRRLRTVFVTTIIGVYIVFVIIVGGCVVWSAICGAPWPLRQLISNRMVPSHPPATAARKPASELAKEVLAKLDSVSLGTNISHLNAQTIAFNTLSQIWQVDFEYQSKTSFLTQKPMTTSDLDNNRKRRSQMLAQFRLEAKPIIADWNAIVEAFSKTESAVKTIKKIEGMDAFGQNLDYSMQYWMEQRADLSDAIAIAEARQDTTSLDPRFQTPMNVGQRLSGGNLGNSSQNLGDGFRRLRIAWRQIEAGSCE